MHTSRHDLANEPYSVNILDVSLQGIDPMGLQAVSKFEAAFNKARSEGKRIKAVLLCSPNNPLGMPDDPVYWEI